ncbi:hypothetical protein [Pseudomonas soli]|uniref:hypothetical protein n=1 Tax=Pseudomonas soli TaxID=1306993 RepID=UPI003CFE95C6
MNYSVRNVALLLSMSLAAASCTQLPHEQSVSGQKSDVGTVNIYDKQEGRPCTLKPIAGMDETYRLGKGKCSSLPNDEAYYFKFDGVPSAVLVTFYDSADCSKTGNFAFMVRTTQSPTTTTIIKLSAAHAASEGIIAPGLRLEWKKGDGQVDGKLSCVRIQY